MMSWRRFLNASHAFAPEGSSKRKIIQIIAVILFFQGVSIALLSSHFGPAIGGLSMVLGIFILAVFPPKLMEVVRTKANQMSVAHEDPLGIRLLDHLFRKTRGTYVAVTLGIAIIVGVPLYNEHLSSRPAIGDFDLLSIILGGILVAYPFTSKRFRVETCFALLFIAFVILILVIPQAILSFNDSVSGGNWYVHYMLAAPFASALNLLGIEASAYAETVSITLNDGTTHAIGISAACAGLYSFSIFVSAFFSFVLVFERLPLRTMALVLPLGLLIAYLGNLFRMVVIGVVGYYHGIDALLWAHDNVGWIVFLVWSSVFWYAVVRYSDRRASIS